MVNYRCWANSEWLQTRKSAVKTADSPDRSAVPHARAGNALTGKEDRHASRVDLNPCQASAAAGLKAPGPRAGRSGRARAHAADPPRRPTSRWPSHG